jgi:hypothetical protein
MLKPQFLLTNKIPFTIVRREAGYRQDGDWVEGTTTELQIEGNIQPLKPTELMLLPEAERTRSWWKLYTDVTLRTAKEGDGGWSADEFDWKGDRYKIMRVNDYTNGMQILEHTKNWCVRVELTPN